MVRPEYFVISHFRRWKRSSVACHRPSSSDVRVPESEAGRHGWPYEAYGAAKPRRFLGHSHQRLPLPDAGADGRQAAAASNAGRARVPRVGRRSRGLHARRARRSLTDTLVWEDLGTPSIALIKIDVEGTDLDVLRGSVRRLRKERPWL